MAAPGSRRAPRPRRPRASTGSPRRVRPLGASPTSSPRWRRGYSRRRARRAPRASTTPRCGREALAPRRPARTAASTWACTSARSSSPRCTRTTRARHAASRHPWRRSPTPICSATSSDARGARASRSCPIRGCRDRAPRGARPRRGRRRWWPTGPSAAAARAVELFGAPARLPLGPAVLAVETGAPLYLVGHARATGRGRWLGAHRATRARDRVDGPRASATCALSSRPQARAFERIVADAPEQWWTLLLPDLGRTRHAGETTDERRRWAAPTCTSTRWPRTASRAWRRSSTRAERARPRRHRHHRPRAHRRRASRRSAMAEARGLPLEVIVGEEITTRGGHLVGPVPDGAHPALGLAARRASPGSTTRAASRSSPIRSCPTRCAPASGTIRAAAGRGRPALPPRRPRGLQPDHGAACAGAAACRRSWRRSAWPRVAAATRTAPRTSGQRRHHVRGRDGGRPARAPSRRATRPGRATRYPWREQLGMFRPPAGQERAAPSATRCAARCAATAPVATWAIPGGRRRPARFDAARGRPGPRASAMKIGLVTPYIYPLPGGVNAHVRYLYENLVARGHDVRIISSTHGPQRSSEGDIIRLGYGFERAHQRLGRHADRLAPLRRSWCSEMLDRERFDVLHFHEPFVPFLSLQLLRYSTSVNVATFHAYCGLEPRLRVRQAHARQRFARRLHGRIAVSAAARHFIDRYFPGDYKVIPNGVDLDRLAARASPSRAGATARPTSSSSAASRTARALMYLLKAYRQLRKRGLRLPAAAGGHGPAGARGRAATSPRGAWAASSCWAGSATTTRRAPSRPRTCSSRRPPARSRSASCSSRRWPPGKPIVCSDIHGYKGVVRRGEQALLVPPRDVEGAGRRRSARCCATRSCGRAWARRAASARRSSAGRTSPPRSRTTTASSSGALAAQAPLPARLPRAPIPADRASTRRDRTRSTRRPERSAARAGVDARRRVGGRADARRDGCRLAAHDADARPSRRTGHGDRGQDHAAEHADPTMPTSGPSISPRSQVDRELEVPVPGRQQAQVDLATAAGQRQARDVRVEEQRTRARPRASAPTTKRRGVAARAARSQAGTRAARGQQRELEGRPAAAWTSVVAARAAPAQRPATTPTVSR